MQDNFKDLPSLGKFVKEVGEKEAPGKRNHNEMRYVEELRQFKSLSDEKANATNSIPWGSPCSFPSHLRKEGELYKFLLRWSRLHIIIKKQLHLHTCQL